MNLQKLWSEKLEGRAWQVREEFLELLQIMKSKNIKNVLEIGTYKGGTSFGFLSIGCKVFSIDIVKQPEIAELEEQFKEDFRFALRADKTFLTPEFDMLFVDGNHRYEECRKDYEEFSPYIKKGGYIVFHDVIKSELHAQQECEVWKVWEEVKSKDNFQIIYNGTWGGIGIMVKE